MWERVKKNRLLLLIIFGLKEGGGSSLKFDCLKRCLIQSASLWEDSWAFLFRDISPASRSSRQLTVLVYVPLSAPALYSTCFLIANPNDSSDFQADHQRHRHAGDLYLRTPRHSAAAHRRRKQLLRRIAGRSTYMVYCFKGSTSGKWGQVQLVTFDRE